ncbi:MAG: hypothetical protein K2O73_08160, partial [Lachnospiraceae bacterium]|nr:hypothetical protein [Lachnospiraceae bacterium]
VHFAQEHVKKDPLIVTPVGICLNYYTQKNNFIMVHFNGERLKLYDNGHLTIVDAALHAGFPNELLFPRRGREIRCTVNGKHRVIRGEAGESAIVRVNGKEVSINAPLQPNSEITIEESTVGGAANAVIEQLEEYTSATITFMVNGRNITCPKFVEVNGSLEAPGYRIQDGDVIENRAFYTVGQLAEFMDVTVDTQSDIILNGRPADMDSLVYENFEVEWTTNDTYVSAEYVESPNAGAVAAASPELKEETAETSASEPQPAADQSMPAAEVTQTAVSQPQAAAETPKPLLQNDLVVGVNDQRIVLNGKEDYVFVDIFDYIDFDLSAGGGRAIVTLINGEDAQYTQQLCDGDKIEIYWREIG